MTASDEFDGSFLVVLSGSRRATQEVIQFRGPAFAEGVRVEVALVESIQATLRSEVVVFT